MAPAPMTLTRSPSFPHRFNAGRSDFYAAFIIGCVIQARIPMPRCALPGNRGDGAKEPEP
jgi:hypothetical protein